MPLKIAIFTETWLPTIDGVTSILGLMLQRLNEQGHQVLMFAPAGGPDTYAGARIIGVDGLYFPIYPDLRITFPNLSVWRNLRQYRPDIMHIVNPAIFGGFAFFFARLLDIPVVASYHTNIADYARHYHLGPIVEAYVRWHTRTLHNQAHLNLCPSSTTLKYLRSQDIRRVRWWRRGIDTQHFCPGPADPAMRQRLTDGHPDEFLLLYVGRHAPEKRLNMLRTVVEQPGLRLALVGDGPSHARLRDHFRGTPTVFTGALRGPELVAAYRAADAFVFPSTTETFGLVALEAMACGLPVIAARTGGVLDTVQDGINGFYFDPAEPEQIGRLVTCLRENVDLRQELARNARQYADTCDWRNTMDQLVGFYELASCVFRRTNANKSPGLWALLRK